MFELGIVLMDKVSGFYGVAIQKEEQINGNIRWGLQPVSEKGNTYPDAIFFDAQTLSIKYDSEFVNHEVIPPKEGEEDILLGSTVCDIVSGIKGITTSRYTHMNGGVFYCITPPPKEL